MPDWRRHDATKIAARGGGTRTERRLAEMDDSEFQDLYGKHFPDFKNGYEKFRDLGILVFCFVCASQIYP